MAFDFKTAVPWGRSMSEYIAMFALSPADLERRILDCGGGPAGFAAGMSQRGRTVVSCDPLYTYSGADIRRRVDATYPTMVESMQREHQRFVWDVHDSPEQRGQARLAAMNTFLDDYDLGRAQGRYVTAALPDLPFADGAFDLALCSHLLFLYTAQLSLDFHLRAIRELLRVARQVRIFPLLDMQGNPSVHLEPVLAALRRQGLGPEIRTVGYEFQRGGNQTLVVPLGSSAPAGD
jgi:SAM-dependent methyltransferase